MVIPVTCKLEVLKIVEIQGKLPLHQSVLHRAARGDHKVALAILHDHPLRAGGSVRSVAVWEDGSQVSPLLTGTHSHLLVDPGVTQSITHIAVLGNCQLVLTWKS